jgi:hypothetical protein
LKYDENLLIPKQDETSQNKLGLNT